MTDGNILAPRDRSLDYVLLATIAIMVSLAGIGWASLTTALSVSGLFCAYYAIMSLVEVNRRFPAATRADRHQIMRNLSTAEQYRIWGAAFTSPLLIGLAGLASL